MRIDLAQAINLLTSGEVAAIPTETVYGLAASLYHPEAAKKIFALKGRPSDNPLILHASSIEEIIPLAASLPPYFHELAKAFWPGPLTLILPANREKIPSIIRAGLPTVGFRIPAHPQAGNLIAQIGPLAMPSANLSGKPSSTSAAHVEEDFGADFPVLDGGPCTQGLESTILYYKDNEWLLIRLGAISAEAFTPILGKAPKQETAGRQKPLCPGQLYRHYAPKAKLLLGPYDESAACILGFAGRSYPPGKRIIFFGSLGNSAEAAENLYNILRGLDRECISSAWVDMDFPLEGIWAAFAERLKKASSGPKP